MGACTGSFIKAPETKTQSPIRSTENHCADQPSFISTGVQLKTKMNMEDSNNEPSESCLVAIGVSETGISAHVQTQSRNV